METLSIEKPKAKKQHKCDFCGLQIEIGEIYEKQNLKNGGDFYSWKSHLTCNEIAGKLSMFDNCGDGVTGEDFKENIKEEYQNIMSEKYNDIFESKTFIFPIFKEQLQFVKIVHGC